jgi:hypothetical protein
LWYTIPRFFLSFLLPPFVWFYSNLWSTAAMLRSLWSRCSHLLHFLPFWTAGPGRSGPVPVVVRWASGEPVALSLASYYPSILPIAPRAVLNCCISFHFERPVRAVLDRSLSWSVGRPENRWHYPWRSIAPRFFLPNVIAPSPLPSGRCPLPWAPTATVVGICSLVSQIR